jgi:hypothetical protein
MTPDHFHCKTLDTVGVFNDGQEDAITCTIDDLYNSDIDHVQENTQYLATHLIRLYISFFFFL